MSNSEQVGTQVSSFVDGEMTQAEVELLLKRLSQNEELQRQWRYSHLISDTLKNQLPAQIDSGFAARVSLALSSEAAHTHNGARRASLFKKVAGGAVAASVAAMGVGAVLLVAQQQGGITNLASMTAQGQQPAEKIVFAASGQRGGNEAVVLVGANEAANPQIDSRMNKYLVNHSEYAVGVNMQSVLPYARIVGQPVK
ncbi:MAG: sigma-E factor negative regulatory protein [Pseudomonadota bacterium]